ncbi:unnamed protein product [Effrenium voratum]|uniref:Uncharacterized protein n=1 Tax=Effrenium voratum TaxID=2562239 RepID=A0AA36I9F4_9DINO|nr:unnamed protein product [Effrenium voratum]
MVAETEAWREALLSKIAGDDDLVGEDLERHKEFLKAKEDALAALAKQDTSKGADRAVREVRLGGASFDEETARKLAAIAGKASQERHAGTWSGPSRRVKQSLQPKQRRKVRSKPQWQGCPKRRQQAWRHPGSLTRSTRSLGYPQLDPKFRDQEWQKKQLQLDSTDPRHNPNLNRDQNDPEFWYHAARKPFNKALLRTEQHWNSRREVWLKQFEQVKDMNEKRALLAELLEDCSAEVRRLVAPILQYSITTNVLCTLLEQAKQKQKSFEEIVADEENLVILRSIRDRVDEFGEKAAEEMLAEFDARSRILAADRQEQLLEDRRVADVNTLAQIMNWGQKCKKDGLFEWEQGNWAEAHASWRQADDTLRGFKAPDKESSRMLFELHGAVLKNLSQACMKLGYWNDAAKVRAPVRGQGS